jgi:hypothetical protein
LDKKNSPQRRTRRKRDEILGISLHFPLPSLTSSPSQLKIFLPFLAPGVQAPFCVSQRPKGWSGGFMPEKGELCEIGAKIGRFI